MIEDASGGSGGGAQLIASVTNADLANTQCTGSVTNVHNVFLVEDTLFTSWTAAGMVAIDVTNPAEPQIIDTFDTNAIESSSNFAGDFGINAAIGLDRMLISDRATGLWVVDVTAVVPLPNAALSGVGLLVIVMLLRRRIIGRLWRRSTR